MYVCDQNLKYVHNVHLYAFFDTYKFVEQKKREKTAFFLCVTSEKYSHF